MWRTIKLLYGTSTNHLCRKQNKQNQAHSRDFCVLPSSLSILIFIISLLKEVKFNSDLLLKVMFSLWENVEVSFQIQHHWKVESKVSQ